MSPIRAAAIIRIAAIFYFLTGLFLVTGASPAAAGLISVFYDVIDWPFDGVGMMITAESRLLAAISGGLLSGFAVMFYLLSAPLIERGDPLGARGGLIGLMAWYVIDSFGSFVAGAPVNVVFNTVFLLPLLWPLVAVRCRPGAEARAPGA